MQGHGRHCMNIGDWRYWAIVSFRFALHGALLRVWRLLRLVLCYLRLRCRGRRWIIIRLRLSPTNIVRGIRQLLLIVTTVGYTKQLNRCVKRRWEIVKAIGNTKRWLATEPVQHCDRMVCCQTCWRPNAVQGHRGGKNKVCRSYVLQRLRNV